MTANDSPDITHDAAGDAELIRYLDDELTAAERVRLEASLAVDPQRTARLATLRRRGRRLQALLAGSDPANSEVEAADPTRMDGVFRLESARRARARAGSTHPRMTLAGRSMQPHGADTTSRPWLRAAIVLFVLVAGAMAVPPVRAWVIDTVQRLVSGDDVPSPSDPVSADPPVRGNEFMVGRIPVTGPSFLIEMVAAPSRGTLTIRLVNDQTASATVTDGNAEGFLTLPGGLRIQTTATSTANYTFTLPRSVTRVILRIPGQEDETISMDVTSPERVINLER